MPMDAKQAENNQRMYARATGDPVWLICTGKTIPILKKDPVEEIEAGRTFNLSWQGAKYVLNYGVKDGGKVPNGCLMPRAAAEFFKAQAAQKWTPRLAFEVKEIGPAVAADPEPPAADPDAPKRGRPKGS
jgi:hypothetical protein